MTPKHIHTDFDYLPMIILLVSLVIVAICNTLYGKKLRTQVVGFFNLRYVDQIMREESSSTQLSSILLTLNGVLISALTLYLAVMQNEPTNETWALYGTCLGGIAGFMLYVIISSLLVTFFFQKDGGLAEYRYTLLLLVQVLGILLIPVNLIGAYGAWGAGETILAGLGLIGLVFAYRLLRGVTLGMSNRVSFIYIILYLCTLEILPLVVLFGLLSGDYFEVN